MAESHGNGRNLLLWVFMAMSCFGAYTQLTETIKPGGYTFFLTWAFIVIGLGGAVAIHFWPKKPQLRDPEPPIRSHWNPTGILEVPPQEETSRGNTDSEDLAFELTDKWPIRRYNSFVHPFFGPMITDDISAWALAALFLGLLSLLCVPAPLALFAGIMAIREIRRNPHLIKGKERAMCGIVMGSIGTLSLVFIIIVLVMHPK